MDQSRYIEVIGTALITRPLDVHRGEIKITVTTRKTKAGLDLSLHLRDQVISALKSAGVSESDIKDTGGSIGHSNWSSKKQLSHELQIEHKDMQVFAKAMAAVENVFTNSQPGYFSGISSDFSFTVKEPVYGKAEQANEQALKDAVSHATRKAELLAEAASCKLGPIEQITELVRLPRPRSNFDPEDPMDFDEHVAVDLCLAEDSFVDYTPVSPRETTRIIRVRVRFGVSHA